MIPKLLEVLDSVTLVSPAGAVLQRQLIMLEGREMYVICYSHNNHSFYLTGEYFVSEVGAKDFFDLHVIVADLTKELSSEQETNYAKFKPLRLHEITDQLHIR